MPTRNVELTEHFDHLIASGIESGQFSDASEAVHEGLRLLEEQQQQDQAKLEWLRSAAQEAIEAIERGEYTTLHPAMRSMLWSPVPSKRHGPHGTRVMLRSVRSALLIEAFTRQL